MVDFLTTHWPLVVAAVAFTAAIALSRGRDTQDEPTLSDYLNGARK